MSPTIGAPVLVALAVAVAVAVAVVLVCHGGGSAGVNTFNACIGQRRFLDTTERRSGHRVIDTIEDRAQGAVVGEFAVLPSPRAAGSFTGTIGPPSGTGESNGRMVLLTRVPTGRDTNAILTCGMPEFPVAP